MLCLIFTKQRLLAGSKLKQSELLQVNGSYQIDYGGQSMAATFQESLTAITNSYQVQRNALGLSPEDKIPLALAFPVDIDANGSSRYKADILHFIKTSKTEQFDLMHADNVAYSFLYGLTNHPQVANEPVVVLEALDDHLNLCYYNIEMKNGKGDIGDVDVHPIPSNRSVPFNFVPLKSLGFATGIQSLFRKIIKEFTQAGLKLDVSDETKIREFLQGNIKGQTIHLSKTHGNVDINAFMEVTESLYEEALTENKISLASRLNHSKLEHLGIKRVVLLGEYLNNQVLQNYLNRDLQIGNKLLLLEQSDRTKEYRIIVEGLARKIVEVQRAREEEERRRWEEERRRREEEERRRREMEMRTQMAKEALLQDIKAQCTDIKQQKNYETQFFPQGEKIGIPKEVIRWNIQEAIRIAELNKPINITDEDLGMTRKYPNNDYPLNTRSNSSKPPVEEPISNTWTPPSRGGGYSGDSVKEKQVVAPPAPRTSFPPMSEVDLPQTLDSEKVHPFEREIAKESFPVQNDRGSIVGKPEAKVEVADPKTEDKPKVLPKEVKDSRNNEIVEARTTTKDTPEKTENKKEEPKEVESAKKDASPRKSLFADQKEKKEIASSGAKNSIDNKKNEESIQIKAKPDPGKKELPKVDKLVKEEEKKEIEEKEDPKAKGTPGVGTKEENNKGEELGKKEPLAPKSEKLPEKPKPSVKETEKVSKNETATISDKKPTVKKEEKEPSPEKKVSPTPGTKAPKIEDKGKRENEKKEDSKDDLARGLKEVASKQSTLDKKLPAKSVGKKKPIETDRSLESIFEIEGVLLDPEFITKKVIHIINHDTKVLKILPTSDLENPKRVEAFNRLYEKELVYYQELSEVYTAKEGQYYFRDFVERNTLKDYVRKIGLDKKDSFDKITSNDLKLILEVLREVKSLTVSHSNLTEFNILVISKRKWNLQKEMEIRLEGFTSKDCTAKEMEEQLHKIWAKLIGSSIYAEFRKKFNI